MEEMLMKPVANLPKAPKYEVFDHEEVKNLSCVKILEGDFAEVSYHYDIVSIDPDEDPDKTVPMRYTYHLMGGVVLPEEKALFEEVTTAILINLVEESNENA